MQPTRSRASFSPSQQLFTKRGHSTEHTRSGTEFCSYVSAEDLQEEQGKPGVNAKRKGELHVGNLRCTSSPFVAQ